MICFHHHRNVGREEGNRKRVLVSVNKTDLVIRNLLLELTLDKTILTQCFLGT
jgi:hypothetical protein